MAVVSPAELLDRLSKGNPVAGILLLGEDAYLRELCRKKIEETYVPDAARDWGIKRFSCRDDDFSDVLGQAQTAPMLAARQVIFVSDVDALERLGEESRDALLKQLSGYLANPAPFSVLVFEAPALDQRMRLAKTLMEKTVTVSVRLAEDPLERARVAASFSLEMAREAGAELERDAAEELCEILNGDLAAIRTEIEKLAAYAGAGRKITLADVELLVISSKKYEVWDLADMLAARKPSDALKFLDRLLREGEAPAQMLGALAWMFRKLMEAQELPPATGGWQAASRLKMRQEKAELAVRQARKFSRSQLSRGLVALYEADNRLKSGGTSQRAVMEFLVARLASPDPA